MGVGRSDFFIKTVARVFVRVVSDSGGAGVVARGCIDSGKMRDDAEGGHSQPQSGRCKGRPLSRSGLTPPQALAAALGIKPAGLDETGGGLRRGEVVE